MPVAEHKDWCSIFQGHREMQRAAQQVAPPAAKTV
jgi:hypothetical protein